MCIKKVRTAIFLSVFFVFCLTVFSVWAIAQAHDDRYRAVGLRELVIIDPKVFYHEKILDKLPQNTRVVLPPLTVPPVPSMVTVMAGTVNCPLVSVIVGKPAANVIVLHPVAGASVSTCRSEPAPLSVLLMTVHASHASPVPSPSVSV